MIMASVMKELTAALKAKYKIKIEKIENFDFCLNIEYWTLTPKLNFAYQFLGLKPIVKLPIFYFHNSFKMSFKMSIGGMFSRHSRVHSS